MRFLGWVGLAILAACAPRVEWVATPAGRRVQVVRTGEGWCVEVAGDAPIRRCHEGLAIETLRARPEGIAYAAEDEGRWRVFVARGRAFVAEPADRAWSGVAEVHLAADGTPGFVARDRRGWWVVAGAHARGPWPEVFAGSFRFGPHGGHAYVALDEGGRSRVVVDGRVGEPWDAVGHLRLTTDGVSLHLARRGAEAFIVRGETRYGPYRAIREVTEVEARVGWVAQRDDGWVAVVDGRASDPYPAVRGLTLDPGGFSEAFVVREGGRERVVHDGTPLPWHDAVDAASLGFAGDRLVRATRQGDRWSVRVGEAAFGEVHAVGSVAAGGGRWAAVVRRSAEDDRWRVWVDGAERGRARWVADLRVDRFGVAYLAGGERGPSVVVDGVVYPFPAVLEGSLVLADRGRRWGCVVMDEGGGHPRVVIDGVRELPLRVDELVSSSLGEDPLEIAALGAEWVRAHVREALATGTRGIPEP